MNSLSQRDDSHQFLAAVGIPPEHDISSIGLADIGHTHMYICIYIYIYVCVYIHISMYTHIHT